MISKLILFFIPSTHSKTKVCHHSCDVGKKHIHKQMLTSPRGMVANACNPSYFGMLSQEDGKFFSLGNLLSSCVKTLKGAPGR